MHTWDHLNHLQLGKYAEYFAKMEFTSAGFDVYTAEVDDKGIDFVVRKDETAYYDVQVKSARGTNYIFMQTFSPHRAGICPNRSPDREPELFSV